MDLLRIELLNPKAAQLLEDLQDLKLIAIREDNGSAFSDFVKGLRRKSKIKKKLTLNEITKEVETVRAKKYAKKGA